jgi:hypothetical protein
MSKKVFVKVSNKIYSEFGLEPEPQIRAGAERNNLGFATMVSSNTGKVLVPESGWSSRTTRSSPRGILCSPKEKNMQKITGTDNQWHALNYETIELCLVRKNFWRKTAIWFF